MSDEMLGTFLALYFLVLIICFVVAIWAIICTCKIFTKFDEPWWKAIIPWYNNYVLCLWTWGSGWWFLTYFVPFLNFVTIIITMFKLAKVFGKGIGFGLGLLFLSPIFLGILAFDNNIQYIYTE